MAARRSLVREEIARKGASGEGASRRTHAATLSAGRGAPRGQIAEIQRSRLIAGAIGAVDDLGYAEVTVAQITSRARVSRRTFYELFANREECLAAVLDEAVKLVEGELAAACLQELRWRDRVRVGTWAMLSFFDREPQLARLCVVQSLRGGPVVLSRRERMLARLAAIVDEGRLERGQGGDLTSLTAEGLVGAAFAILHTRLLGGGREPLVSLGEELIGLILLPYLGPAATRQEQARSAPDPLPGAARQFAKLARVTSDPLEGVPMRLTYRTARVLEGIGEHPGASNREIAERAGIADQGQVSKLLARLERIGLLSNQGAGHLKGEPNAWALTAKGESIAQSIRVRSLNQSQAA